MRIHPFYKTLQAHQGVDYTIPEGSRVFATADGRVSDVMRRNSTQGLTVVIDHGDGYTTSYSHLSPATSPRGSRCAAATSSPSRATPASRSPHLHYEVRHNGMRVDPIHYFFMELSPAEYQRIMRIAQSGMQSFDDVHSTAASPAAAFAAACFSLQQHHTNDEQPRADN